MDLSIYRDTYLCLTFFEAVIVWENRGLSRAAMFNRLKQLQQHTKDPILKVPVTSLLWKLTQVNEQVYDRMIAAADSGDLLFPPNFHLS